MFKSSSSAAKLTPAQQRERDVAVNQFVGMTNATPADTQRLLRKAGYNVHRAVEYFFNDPAAQSNANAANPAIREVDKKLGEIWERYKDPSQPDLITIEGTMQLCEAFGVDPENDTILFCLATDLNSKTIGEWKKDDWIRGWKSINPNVSSIAQMQEQFPKLRSKLKTDPEYFKKVYMHAFVISLAPGARVLPVDSAISFWQVFIRPALTSRPSALSRIIDPDLGSTTTPAFTESDLDDWVAFCQKRGKAVSKDVYSLLIPYIRAFDGNYENYDEDGAWPSVIDDFHASQKAKKGSSAMDTT